jgi:hypothetical protein
MSQMKSTEQLADDSHILWKAAPERAYVCDKPADGSGWWLSAYNVMTPIRDIAVAQKTRHCSFNFSSSQLLLLEQRASFEDYFVLCWYSLQTFLV